MRRTLDRGSVIGLVVGVGCILAGYLQEDGKASDVIRGSAALIVLGGCLGATLVANPTHLVLRAVRRIPEIFFEARDDKQALIESVVQFSTKARKNGIVALEQEALELKDPFLRKALTLAVDGVDLGEIRSSMELEIHLEEERHEQEAKVYESAGGFAPTIGIIGAVLGLIIVMGSIANLDAVGHGIASAFVATIYGVGSANLFFLPVAHKIRLRASAETERRELLLEGVAGIVEGLNPKLIRGKLEAFIGSVPAKPAAKKGSAPRQSAEART